MWLSVETDKSRSRVQDAYTLRCIPQVWSVWQYTHVHSFEMTNGEHLLIRNLRLLCACVFVWVWLLQVHGVVNDTIAFVQKVINTELNSATDNPVSFTNNYLITRNLQLCCAFPLFIFNFWKGSHIWGNSANPLVDLSNKRTNFQIWNNRQHWNNRAMLIVRPWMCTFRHREEHMAAEKPQLIHMIDTDNRAFNYLSLLYSIKIDSKSWSYISVSDMYEYYIVKQKEQEG